MLPKARKTKIDFDALGDQMLQLKEKLMREGVPEDAEAAYRYLYAYSLTPRSAEMAPAALTGLLDEAAAALDDGARERARRAARDLAACCMSPGSP